MPLKKIVVIGPESTGKSTLCQDLARYYGTAWVPEYAREFLLSLGRPYTYEDLLTIARGQIALEDRIAARQEKDQYLFIDTDMYIMKVWGEYVYGQCAPWILRQIATRKYDGYLLCMTDLPWTPDELREYPDLESREELFRIYRDDLIHQDTPWTTISGVAGERLAMAIRWLDGKFPLL